MWILQATIYRILWRQTPFIYVRMKGNAKPEDALIKAISKVREVNEVFSKELERVMKA